MKNMRKNIYRIIEVNEDNDTLGKIYDFLIMITVILSIVSLAFRNTYRLFFYVELFSVAVFIIDYLLRFITADFLLNKFKISFLIYPFTPMAIIDLLSVLPFFAVICGGIRIPQLFRLLRTLKLLRLFKFIRYSKSLNLIVNVFRRQKRVLSVVAIIAICYVLISALIMYNIEPNHFDNFFEAIYWAAITLTTIGYGDIYPSTTTGRIVTVVSSIFGIAVVALPSSIITAGYLSEINGKK